MLDNKNKFVLFLLALVGSACAAFLLLVPASSASAQTRSGTDPAYQSAPPRPDFPGAKDKDVSQSDKSGYPDPAASPRPDFPGPKKSDGPQK